MKSFGIESDSRESRLAIVNAGYANKADLLGLRIVCTGHKDRIDKSPPRRKTRTIGPRCRKWRESSAVPRHRSINQRIYETGEQLWNPFFRDLVSLPVLHETARQAKHLIRDRLAAVPTNRLHYSSSGWKGNIMEGNNITRRILKYF